MQGARINTQVVFPCAIALLPSRGLMGNHGGAQGPAATIARFQSCIHTQGGSSRDVHIQGVGVGVAVPGTGRLGVSQFKNSKAKNS